MSYEVTGIVRGPINSEDLTPIPGTDWIVACGHVGPTVSTGRLYVVDTRDLSCTELFPYNLTFDPDRTLTGAAEGSLDPDTLHPHGIDVGSGPDGQPTLYVVNHGGTESVELFRIDFSGPYPSLRWLASVTLPHGLWGNDVARVDGGGFVVSSSFDVSEGREKAMARMAAGELNGAVAEWSPSGGWTIHPGGQVNCANGVAVSSDGEWIYVACTLPKSIRKFSRGPGPLEIHEVTLDTMVDNITWTADGRHLLATGASASYAEFRAALDGPGPRARVRSKVVQIDAETLEGVELAEYGPDEFGLATTALEVGEEIWIGSVRFDGLARLTRS
jgi:hypothetical protein